MRRFTFILMLAISGVYTLAWAVQSLPSLVVSAPPADEIVLRHADKLYYNQYVNRDAQILVGNVEFEHQGAIMTCDSALYYKETKSFDAYGNVVFVQGDTLSLNSDILYYKGDIRKAYAMSDPGDSVKLRHRNTFLYSENIEYDRVTDIGTFPNKGRLVDLDQDNELVSDFGEYSPKTREAKFYYNVRLDNPRPPKKKTSWLVSDTLYYNTKSGVAQVLGPSDLYHGENTIMNTTNGYYYTQSKEARFYDRPTLQHVEREVTGDSMYYDGNTHVSEAFGKVEYVDKANKNKFYGNYALYNDTSGYAEAYDSALCVDYSQPDTMYCHADTFKLFTYNIDTDSVYRVVHAHPHVRAFRNDIQAVCDSLVINGQDTCAIMYKDPIVWQEGQQILGEEIWIWSNDSTLDSVYVINQALLVEQIDSMHYNQIASKEMHSYFRGKEIYLNVADLNVFLNYHPFDSDSLMIGMVHAESSQLKMFMEDKKVQKIWMPATTGQMYPIEQTPPDKRLLSNFAWFEDIRPKDKDDLMVWKPKTAGSELKESVRHVAPTQKLSNIKRTKKDEPIQSETTP